MKNLNITFEDADFKKLEKIREAQYPACKSWEEFILVITGAKELKDYLTSIKSSSNSKERAI